MARQATLGGMDVGQYLVYQRQPEQIVSSIRRQVFKVLLCQEHRGERSLKARHLAELEQLMDQFRVGVCGNYYLEPVKESRDDFRLEREFTAQHMFGYFVFNMDRFGSANLARNYVKVWEHMMINYAYRTRRPLVEKLENRNRVIFHRLLHFVESSPSAALWAAGMLCCCCRYKSLALRLLDFHHSESDECPAYVRLLRSLPAHRSMPQLVAILRFLRALLLTHVEVARYAFNRDAGLLLQAFNGLLQPGSNYYVRMTGIELLSQLIQNRWLAGKLAGPYTSSASNFELLLGALTQAQKHGRKAELVQLFQVIRLFVLNPANEQPGPVRDQLIAHCLPLCRLVEQVQQIRSYTDIALFRPEYANVLERLNRLTEKPEPRSASGLRSGSRSELLAASEDDQL